MAPLTYVMALSLAVACYNASAEVRGTDVPPLPACFALPHARQPPASQQLPLVHTIPCTRPSLNLP